MRSMVRTLILVALVSALMMPTVPVDADAPISPTAPGWAQGDEVDPWSQVADIGGRFVENLGQWDEGAMFVTDTSFGHAVLCSDGVLYDVVGQDGGHRVKVAFQGDSAVSPEGIDDLGYDSNFFLGNDPDLWVRGARTFSEVLYREVWPGTSIRYYFADGNLKYDLLLDAEADPSMVLFRVIGAEGMETKGDVLDIDLAGGLSIQDRDLVAWYDDGELVDASFEQDGDVYGFSVTKETGRSMVIDPVVVHSSSFIGGTYADSVTDVELDGEGNIYILSSTGSDDYPVTTGAYDDEMSQVDAGVTKFNHNCSRIIWSTFVGGSSFDTVAGLELDKQNNVYFAGATWSHDYPCTKGAFNSQFNLGQNNYQMDPFLTKLKDDGTDLVYSTYVGGSHTEWVGDIKVYDGKATVVGQTQSTDFPTEAGSYGGVHGDGFLFTMNENGSRIVDTFFWGGFGSELASCLAFAPNGDIVVGGRTSSMDMFTTPGVFQQTRPCFTSGFICRFTPSTDNLVFSTYFGGAYSTSINDLTLDDDENIYIGGTTFMSGPGVVFITTPGAYQEDFHGRYDSFLAKMDPNATRLEYCTLLGGDGDDDVYDVELDSEGHLVAVGSVAIGTNFTVTQDCLDDKWEGESEGFVFILNDDGTAPVYSTFYGGQQADGVYSVKIDDVDNLVLAGGTASLDFPLKEDGFQKKLSGGSDGFVSIVGEYLPTSEPLDLRANGGEGLITLDWEFPADNGGYPVKRFLLYRGTSEDDLRFYRDVGASNVAVDKDVDWGVYQYYAVYASNGKGISPSSNVAFNRSVTVPDAPLNMTGTVMFDSVVIEWEAPDFTGGLPITGYTIYRIAQGDHVELVTPLSGDVNTFEDTIVADGTNYTYAMTARNDFGESREPVRITIRTFDVPTPPLSLSHTYGDLFIHLAWEPPRDDFGLPVEGYKVYRWTGEGPSEVVGEVDASDPTYIDTQVTVGTLYGYSISAKNGKGESEPSVGIEAMAMVPPDPPQGVEAIASDLFVKISWSPPVFDGASPLMGYRVYLGDPEDEFTCLGGPNTMGIAEPQLSFLHDIPYDGIVRSYFVTAVNAEGESEPSGIVTTTLYSVPGTPEDLTVEWGDGRLEIGWNPPSTDGGTPVMGYTLYRQLEGDVGYTPIAALAIDEISYIDLEAMNGVEYKYTLTAYNLVGESDQCPPVWAVPAGLPGTPEGVLAVGGVGSVQVTWGPPSDDGGHPLMGYLLFRMEEGGTMEVLSQLGPDVSEYADDEVVNGVVYTYSITAFTDVGDSERSEYATAMPYGPPGGPLNLAAHWVDGRVQLSWSSPSDDGGSAVTGYHVHRHDRDDGNMTELSHLVLSLVDTEVEMDATYTYTVYALNSAGTGPGTEVTVTVPPAAMDPPQSSGGSNWAFLVVALVLLAVAALLVIARRRGGMPGLAIL